MRWLGLTLAVLCSVAACAGCGRRSVPSGGGASSAPGGNRPLAGRTFDRPDLGIRLEHPAGWATRPSTDYVLLLTPAGARAAAGGDAPSISLDVPSLPLHIPNLIPIGPVRSGYLDDLRKAVGPVTSRNETPPPIPGAAARQVRSTWTDAGGRPNQETALLLVHGDRVYIVRARSLVSDEPAVRDAFDEVVRSMEWTTGRRADN
jgi:hypothetical protein